MPARKVKRYDRPCTVSVLDHLNHRDLPGSQSSCIRAFETAVFPTQNSNPPVDPCSSHTKRGTRPRNAVLPALEQRASCSSRLRRKGSSSRPVRLLAHQRRFTGWDIGLPRSSLARSLSHPTASIAKSTQSPSPGIKSRCGTVSVSPRGMASTYLEFHPTQVGIIVFRLGGL
jgi:hypothetical protein